MQVLHMHQIEKRFGGAAALRGASLRLVAGQVHAVIGENGAGKSTLMRVLVGAVHADAGQMQLDGQRYASRGPEAARRAGVEMVHQELALAPHLTVEQNIVLGRESAAAGVVQRGRLRQRALAALQAVGAEGIAPHTRVAALGPGARQLVEIARAVSTDPRILVLDEPTSSLGHADAERVYAAVRRLRDAGVAVVLISHHFQEIRALATRVTVLRDGRTVWSGAVADATDAQLVHHMTGDAGARALEGDADADTRVGAAGAVGAATDATAASDAAAASGGSAATDAVAAGTAANARTATDASTRVPSITRHPLLRVSGLRSARMRHAASFDLHAGQTLGIAGLVGSGRTALLRALAGLDAPVAGSLVMQGCAIDLRDGPAHALAAGIALVSEDRRHEGLALRMPWGVNLALPTLGRLARGGMLSPARIAAAAERGRTALGIRAGSPWQRAGELSGGNQQKVAIARVLELNARVVLLDEPTRGVDVAAKAQIQALVHRMAREGRAVIVVSSDAPQLLMNCDRVALMRDGVLGVARPSAQVVEANLVGESFRGSSGDAA